MYVIIKQKFLPKKNFKNINKCINGRINYPITCSNGCIVKSK